MAADIEALKEIKFGGAKSRGFVKGGMAFVGPLLREAPRQMLRIAFVRFLICALRYFWFVKVRKRLQIFAPEGSSVATETIPHNLRGMFDFSVERSTRLIGPLAAIETIREAIDRKTILSIGARNEGEIYNLRGYGFRGRNIAAIDLISYSPLITLGDMHNLAFADSSFDACISGWVFAYSNDCARAAAEIVRVVRHGGIVAIGVEWVRVTPAEKAVEIGYCPGADVHIKTIDQILVFFGDAVGQVFFRHDTQDSNPERTIGDLLCLFSIRK